MGVTTGARLLRQPTTPTPPAVALGLRVRDAPPRRGVGHSLDTACKSATRRRGLTQGSGSAPGRTRAVSACATRATRLARTRKRALSLVAHQCKLSRTACDRSGTRRVGRTMRAGVGLSCRAIACGGAPPPKARKSCTGCAWAMGCGATHGTVARVCCDRQVTGATPTVRKARSSSKRGRCVTHCLSDGTTGATRRSTRARGRAFGMFYWGGKNEYESIGVAGHERAPSEGRRAGRARVGGPSGSARATRPAGTARRTPWGPCGTE